MEKHWEHFSHGADIGIRGVGTSREEAFEEIAVALTAVVTDPGKVRAQSAVPIDCEAASDEFLVVDWLNAVIYEMAIQKVLFGRFEIRLDGFRLHATAWGEPVDVERHEPAVEVKGATYTALDFNQGPDGAWSAQCVVDV